MSNKIEAISGIAKVVRDRVVAVNSFDAVAEQIVDSLFDILRLSGDDGIFGFCFAVEDVVGVLMTKKAF